MKSRFLLLVLAAAAISSCSTSYKSGQTPDDVYYSPAKETEEYVEVKQSNNSRYRSYENDNADDRWLRMRVRNPYRWNAFDDYDWNTYSSWSNNWNSPYSSNWNSYWNGYYNWNSWYNPYCRNVVIVNPKSNPAAYNKVRNFSLNSYTNTNYNNTNTVARTKGSMRLPNTGGGSYNNSNSNSLGNSLRKVFSGNNSNSFSNTNGSNSSGSSSGGDRSSRSYTPSSSGSSSSGSSSSGSSSSGGSSSGGSSSGRRGG